MRPTLPGRVALLRGNAADLHLPDASVDLIVTSPPFWQQRAYTDNGEVYPGQIGLEATPPEYIAALLACTREWMRVLKPGGSIFVDLGDKFSDRAEGPTSSRSYRSDRGDVIPRGVNSIKWAPRKSLLLLPERYRIACLDELRLTVREVLVWDKTNAMPESVRDRCRRTHEDWVHLTKGERYYSAADRIRMPHAGEGLTDAARGLGYVRAANGDPHARDRANGMAGYPRTAHPLGALPGSVWQVPTQALIIPPEVAHARCCDGAARGGCTDGLDHYAAFPLEWPARLIAGFAPAAVCTACDEGRRPVTETEHDREGRTTNGPKSILRRNQSPGWEARARRKTAIVGETCACPDTSAPTRPAVVLDPFGGTGTTALAAAAAGRDGISVEMSEDYCRLAAWRTTDPREIDRALRAVDPARPPAPRRPRTPDGMDALFELPAVP